MPADGGVGEPFVFEVDVPAHPYEVLDIAIAAGLADRAADGEAVPRGEEVGSGPHPAFGHPLHNVERGQTEWRWRSRLLRASSSQAALRPTRRWFDWRLGLASGAGTIG